MVLDYDSSDDRKIGQLRVLLDIDHDRLSDLRVTLISPSGTQSVLLYRPGINPDTGTGSGYGASSFRHYFTDTNFLGETMGGEWKLQVDDLVTGMGGSVNMWGLEITGISDGADDEFFYTDEFADAQMFPAARSALGDTDGGTDRINLAALSTGCRIDLRPAGSVGLASSIAGRAVTIGDGAAFEKVYGGDGNDMFIGSAGANTLEGARGDDTLEGGLGSNLLEGGDGLDTASYRFAATGVSVSLALTTAQATGGAGSDVLVSMENLAGSDFADTLTGSAGANLLLGHAGDDSLTGLDGADTLDGGAGADTLAGGAGDDLYLVENPADLTVEAVAGGRDRVETALAWTLGANVEDLTLTGTAAINGTGNGFGNAITGNTAANLLDGLAGNDTLSGGAGNDTLIGGAGVDQLAGGTGNDVYDVDAVTDAVIEGLNEGTDTIRASVGIAALADNVEAVELQGTAALDATGNALANTLTGNAAGNSLSGGDASDTLVGLDGNDTLDGGTGNDTLLGGDGGDWLIGGSGSDRFVFSGNLAPASEIIVDFDGAGAAAGDLIDLTGIDANTAAAGDQAFIFLGTIAFVTGQAGRLRVSASGPDTRIEGEVTGDGIADFAIIVRDALPTSWTAADFLL